MYFEPCQRESKTEGKEGILGHVLPIMHGICTCTCSRVLFARLVCMCAYCVLLYIIMLFSVL